MAMARDFVIFGRFRILGVGSSALASVKRQQNRRATMAKSARECMKKKERKKEKAFKICSIKRTDIDFANRKEELVIQLVMQKSEIVVYCT